jgi:CheY-like chemotaxis protein
MKPTPRQFPGLRVLLVEDNPVNQRVAQLMLQGLGVCVSTAGDGNEALACVDAESFDVILMDCQMPQLDGFEATARIRARRDARASTPIVALTANAMSGDRERCLNAGMDDYLSKPFNRQALSDALGRCLQLISRD